MTKEKLEPNLITIEQFDLSFKLPERVGVENALNYWSMVSMYFKTKNHILKIWEAAIECDLLQDWQCERFPDPKVPLEDVPVEDEIFVANLIITVVNHVQSFMSATRSVEKN